MKDLYTGKEIERESKPSYLLPTVLVIVSLIGLMSVGALVYKDFGSEDSIKPLDTKEKVLEGKVVFEMNDEVEVLGEMINMSIKVVENKGKLDIMLVAEDVGLTEIMSLVKFN